MSEPSLVHLVASHPHGVSVGGPLATPAPVTVHAVPIQQHAPLGVLAAAAVAAAAAHPAVPALFPVEHAAAPGEHPQPRSQARPIPAAADTASELSVSSSPDLPVNAFESLLVQARRAARQRKEREVGLQQTEIEYLLAGSPPRAWRRRRGGGAGVV
jgi:hypothetical protein